MPPDGNANYAWIQDFASHLAPDGRAGFVLANGSLTTMTSGEGDDPRSADPRRPGRLHRRAARAALLHDRYSVCLWFLDRNKAGADERDRKGETLFIDARQMGQKISRTQIELSDEEIARIVGTYHRWRGTLEGEYVDEAGFCKSASLDEVEAAGFTLSPGRYVGAPETEEDEVEFEERMATLVERLSEEMAENETLAGDVKEALVRIGYGV